VLHEVRANGACRLLLTPLPALALGQPADGLQVGNTRPIFSTCYTPDPTKGLSCHDLFQAHKKSPVLLSISEMSLQWQNKPSPCLPYMDDGNETGRGSSGRASGA